MDLYFLSDKNLDGYTLHPRVPSNYLVNNGYEDGTTPRVCFSTSIDGALMALSQNLEGKEFYVHVPAGNYQGVKPTIRQVPDSELTGEYWITEDVVLKNVGKIKVGTAKPGEYQYVYGVTKVASLYKWNWSWISTQSESSLDENKESINEDIMSSFIESVLKNSPDILYNKDKFDSGEINLCFITGHSGSGKSTLGRNLQSDTIEHYEMDDLQCIKDHFTMANLKEYGDLIYSYFNGPGKKFYVSEEELREKKIPGAEYEDKLFPGFVHYAMDYAKKHKDRKFVIEGVWLFCDDDNGHPWFTPDEFKDCAFYIKGTSALISKIRAAKRDSSDNKTQIDRALSFTKNFFKNLKWYIIDEKRINVFRSYFKQKLDEVEISTYDGSVNETSIWYEEDDMDFVQTHESTNVNLNITGISKHEPFFDFDEILDEADYSKIDKTSIISTKVYKVIEKQMPSKWPAIKRLIGQWFTAHYDDLYAVAPYKIIPFTLKDYDDFWKAFGVKPSVIDSIMKECYFYDLDFHPRCAKSSFIAVMLMIIRYHLKKNDKKSAMIATIYTAFSGQIYASLYSNSFKYNTKREVMDYVINNKINDRYELKRAGTVFGAIEKYSESWIASYKKLLISNHDDDDYKNLVQQLRDRVKSFLKNIATVYYDADSKGEYLNYSTNNMEEENFHLMNTITTIADKATEKTMNYIVTKDVSYKYCGMVADENVRKDEIRNIMTSIYQNHDNINDLRRVINIMIVDFIKDYPEESISDIKFINHAMATRPNTKNKDILFIRETIIKWLNQNSVEYVRRKSRVATATSYYRAVQKMIILAIMAANK